MTRDFIPLRIAVLTVSDTRTLAEDRSGDTLAERIAGADHHLAARMITTDDRGRIGAQLRAWIADPDIDAIISTGGTGLTGRDVTVEAHRDVYEKEIDAFSTIFTIVSMEKNRHIRGAEPRYRRRRGPDLSIRLARQPRCLQGCLGRDFGSSIRLSPQALQLCRDHAAPGRAFASEIAGRNFSATESRRPCVIFM